ncbi:adhesion G protein-coupled receptor E1-like [Sinocyclocheilus rhinocerous]|uniref:adhesion G protein-coupled receptor E1-like n=1 Tax=Sinocyclocheilus rhinocerous TaxID=307959 RepID=UPI0007B8F9C9|nr:PREDICTED: adhesion G protein-coupled receptor E1-like [Sinocyclocheilus rhinocerous]
MTALLLALASVKRVGDLQALAQILTLLALPAADGEQGLNPFCPVRALRAYIERSGLFRQSEQLFVCFGGRCKGLPVTKQRLSRWIVDAIALAYASEGLQCPIGVRAHSTRGMASSWVWSSGISITNLSVDPCNNYTVLDEPRRSINNTNFLQSTPSYNCDTSVTWSGWYRLFINGLNAYMPETCVAIGHCDTATTLWIRGGHPTVQDGVVTRDVCGHWHNYCCFFWSFPIKVKACPGNYYVYELISPAVYCSGYCADVGSINTSSTTVTPAIVSTVYTCVDPCYNYSVLDDPWRATNNTNASVRKCDTSVTWSGWYRVFINGLSAQIPDTCVEKTGCGTDIPLWIRGGHPTVKDGVVTRDVCGHWHNYCCYHGSYPIKVKACPGNYYVYELVRPNYCNFAYCAAVTNISSTETTVTPEMSSAAINITLQEGCTTSGGCLQNLFEQIENITAQVLPLNIVTDILTVAFNASEKILETTTSASPTELASYGNHMLKTSEKLISTLVKPTNTNDSVSFTLPTVEGQVFMVGPQVTLDKIPRLDTTNSSVDIDLIGIAKSNYETPAVAFMSYNTMENLLKPDFFNTSNDTVKTMMSTVISATLPKTTNTKLTEPVNFTLKHIREFDVSGSLSCVYWNISEWIVDGCSVLKTNGSYTVCSCDHLSTFALIMQTIRPPVSDSLLELLNLVCVIVGLVFFSLALLTFALCQWSPGVNNVARINICVSLLLAHLLFLLTQQFLSLIRRQQVLCAVISGLLHFLFLSGFVWMFIEAVLLFICVKNLSQISSKKKEVLSSGFLCVIGYVVALVVVCVSVGLVPEGYGSEHCWLKMDKSFIWSFLGPVCVILALNMILFIKIVITLNSALKNLNAEVSQMKQTKIMVFKTLAQFVVLGCSWILGFFTNDSKVLEILFLILNSQQGTFIFLIYGVLNNEVMQQFRKFFRCLCCIKQH